MLLASFALGAAMLASIPTPLAVPPVTLTSAWTTIPLPEMPLGIAEHDGQLWVCGANEMIAMSADAGSHWTLLHQQKDGELLFALAFPGGNEVQAYGTRGRRLDSTDGGTTWTRGKFQPDTDWTRVAMIGPHGIAINRIEFGWTDDGGLHWQRHNVPSGRGAPDGGTTLAMALRDPAQAVIATEGAENPSVISTMDGGRHWQVTDFDHNIHWSGLRLAKTTFQLFGKFGDGSGPPQPMATTSDDGEHWSQAAAPVADFKSCSVQGCTATRGWLDSRAATAQLRNLPFDDAEPGYTGWAAESDTVCRVTRVLRCQSGSEPWQPPQPERAKTIPPIAVSQPSADWPLSERRAHVYAMVVLGVWIGADGQVKQIVIEDAPAPDFAESAVRAVSRWKFTPAMRKGQAVAFSANVEVSFRSGG